MGEGLRKSVALLSVLLLLTVFRCMAACIVSDTGVPVPLPSSTAVPPCHQHPAPAQGPRNSVPCQSHPGQLAYSIPQLAQHIDLPVMTAAAYTSLATPRERYSPRGGIFSHRPRLARPALVLRL